MNKKSLDTALSGIADQYLMEASDPTAIRRKFQRPMPRIRPFLIAASVAVITVSLLLSFVVLFKKGQTPEGPKTPGSSTTPLPGGHTTDVPEPDIPTPPVVVPPMVPEGYTAIALTFRSNGNGTSTVVGLEEYFPKEEFTVEDDKKELAVAYTQTEYLFPQNRLLYFQYGDDIRVGIDYSDEVTNTTEVVIPDGVTEIPQYAFCNFRKLERVTVPASVTKIGYSAFSYCSALRELDLPDGITEIDRYAFLECSSLASINIPAGLTVIPECMLDGCTALTGITIPDGATEIGVRAFAGTAVTELTIPKSVQKIGAGILIGCKDLNSLTIPFLGEVREQPRTMEYLFSTSMWAKQPRLEALILTDALEICDYAFRAESAYYIHTLVLNEGIIAIGKDVYPSQGSALKEVRIPDSVVVLNSFCGYETEKLYIGAGVKTIDPLYEACPAMKELTVSEQNPYFCAVGNVLFSKDMKVLVRHFGNAPSAEYTVPETVTAIADYAFCYVGKLSRVILPDGLSQIGYAVFYQCFDLTGINIPASVAVMGNSVFWSNNEKLTIRCEAPARPRGWDENWNATYSATVIWGATK